MTRQQRDIIQAMDQRAERALETHGHQQKIDLGVIKAVTLSGASIQLSESARFLQNVPSVAGVELVIGATVLVVRAGRRDWVILGAVEAGNSTTATIENQSPVSKPASVTATAHAGYSEIKWTASYFDIRCYIVQINTSESESGATNIVTDNTQYLYFNDAGTYYVRIRGIGPRWHAGAWSDWKEATITTASPITLTAAADELLEIDGWELDLDEQFINLVLAGPTGGASAVPDFRALVLDDLPDVAIEDIFSFSFGGAIGVVAGTRRQRIPWNITIVEAYLDLVTAGSDATTVDFNVNGTTIFTDQGERPSLGNGENQATSGTPAVTEASAGNYFTCDVDVAGTGAENLYATILFRRR